MYQLSPSKIDQFRIYKDEVFALEKDGLIERLIGESEQTEAMKFGEDVHTFLETGEVGGLLTEEIKQLLPYREMWIDRIKEQWIDYELMDGVLCRMRVDMMHGMVIEDIKVSGRFWGVDYYEQSVQWKMYLLATDCKKFTYRIFQKTKERPVKFTYHSFDFLAYQGMKDEVVDLAKGLIKFCQDNGIEDAIKTRQHQKTKTL